MIPLLLVVLLPPARLAPAVCTIWFSCFPLVLLAPTFAVAPFVVFVDMLLPCHFCLDYLFIVANDKIIMALMVR